MGISDIHDDRLGPVKQAEIRWQPVETSAEEVVEKLHHTCRKSENTSVAAVVVRKLKQLGLNTTEAVVENLADISESEVDANGNALLQDGIRNCERKNKTGGLTYLGGVSGKE